MRLSLLLLFALSAFQGCEGQLVMYFVNALSDMLQRNGLKKPIIPDPYAQAVDQNTVVDEGVGLTGNMLLNLKEKLTKLNKTVVVPAKPQVGKFTWLNRTSAELRGEKSDEKMTPKPKYRFLEPLTAKTFTATSLPRLDKNTETRTRSELSRPPPVSERRIRLRPAELSALESRFAALRPRTRRPVAPETPRTVPPRLTRPRPVIRPTPSVVPQVRVIHANPNQVDVRTLNSGRTDNSAIVIVPQQVGPPGAVQPPFAGRVPGRGPVIGPRFLQSGPPLINQLPRQPQFQGRPNLAPQQPQINVNPRNPGSPLPPLIPAVRPPNDIPDLSIPFDSRPRPDGTVAQDPLEALANQQNATEEEERMNNVSPNAPRTLFIPSKPQPNVGNANQQQVPNRGIPPPSARQPTNQGPENRGPNQRQRPPLVRGPNGNLQPIRRPLPVQGPPNLPQLGQGAPIGFGNQTAATPGSNPNIRRRPVQNIRLPPGYRIMNRGGVPNGGAPRRGLPLMPLNRGGANVPGFTPLNGTRRAPVPNQGRPPVNAGPPTLINQPLSGNRQNAVPRPTVNNQPPRRINLGTGVPQGPGGRRMVLRRPVQGPPPNPNAPNRGPPIRGNQQQGARIPNQGRPQQPQPTGQNPNQARQPNQGQVVDPRQRPPMNAGPPTLTGPIRFPNGPNPQNQNPGNTRNRQPNPNRASNIPPGFHIRRRVNGQVPNQVPRRPNLPNGPPPGFVHPAQRGPQPRPQFTPRVPPVRPQNGNNQPQFRSVQPVRRIQNPNPQNQQVGPQRRGPSPPATGPPADPRPVVPRLGGSFRESLQNVERISSN